MLCAILVLLAVTIEGAKTPPGHCDADCVRQSLLSGRRLMTAYFGDDIDGPRDPVCLITMDMVTQLPELKELFGSVGYNNEQTVKKAAMRLINKCMEATKIDKE